MINFSGWRLARPFARGIPGDRQYGPVVRAQGCQAALDVGKARSLFASFALSAQEAPHIAIGCRDGGRVPAGA